MDVGRILLFLSLYVAVLVGPWVVALRLRPVPFDAPFPTRRELIALPVAIVLVPATSYLTASAGYLFFIEGPVLTVALCVSGAAIAGRRPFAYTATLALLHLLGVLLWLPKTTGKAFDFADRVAGIPCLPIFVAVALACGGMGGLFLFCLWQAEEWQAEEWQAEEWQAEEWQAEEWQAEEMIAPASE